MRKIDAEALARAIKTECNPYGKPTIDFESGKKVLKIIDNAPTVEERPKGKWRSVGFEKGYAFCICSECGNTTRLYRDSKNEFCCIADIRNKVIACMYCGARMER